MRSRSRPLARACSACWRRARAGWHWRRSKPARWAAWRPRCCSWSWPGAVLALRPPRRRQPRNAPAPACCAAHARRRGAWRAEGRSARHGPARRAQGGPRAGGRRGGAAGARRAAAAAAAGRVRCIRRGGAGGSAPHSRGLRAASWRLSAGRGRMAVTALIALGQGIRHRACRATQGSGTGCHGRAGCGRADGLADPKRVCDRLPRRGGRLRRPSWRPLPPPQPSRGATRRSPPPPRPRRRWLVRAQAWRRRRPHARARWRPPRPPRRAPARRRRAARCSRRAPWPPTWTPPHRRAPQRDHSDCLAALPLLPVEGRLLVFWREERGARSGPLQHSSI